MGGWNGMGGLVHQTEHWDLWGDTLPSMRGTGTCGGIFQHALLHEWAAIRGTFLYITRKAPCQSFPCWHWKKVFHGLNLNIWCQRRDVQEQRNCGGLLWYYVFMYGQFRRSFVSFTAMYWGQCWLDAHNMQPNPHLNAEKTHAGMWARTHKHTHTRTHAAL